MPVALDRPLAPMQRALWMSQRMNPEAPVQNMALLVHIDDRIDPARLAVAFEKLVDQVDVLRTRIIEPQGTPIVRLDAEPQQAATLPISRADAEQWATARVAPPIDISVRGYDSVMLQHEDNTVSWYLALHHTITDATSSANVFAATAAIYHGEQVDPGSYYAWAQQFSKTSIDADESPDAKRRAQATTYWQQRKPAPGIDQLYQPADRRDGQAGGYRRDGARRGSRRMVGSKPKRLAGLDRFLTPIAKASHISG